MTDSTPLSGNVRFGKRKLHIQTTLNAKLPAAIVQVMDGNEQIDQREYHIAKGDNDDLLELEVKQCHDMVIADLDLLNATMHNVTTTRNADANVKLGNLLLAKGLVDEAIEISRSALKLQADIPGGYYLLGQALCKKGELEESLQNLEKAIQQTPDYPDVLLWMGRVHREMKQYNMAVNMVRTALEINPDYVQAHFNLGLYLIESAHFDPKNVEMSTPIERIKEAKPSLLRAASLSSHFSRKKIGLVLDLLDDLDQWGEAVQQLQQIADSRVMESRGLIVDSEFYLRYMFTDPQREHRSLDNYIKLLERTAGQHPDYPDVRSSLGSAYLVRCWQYFGKAVEEYREAVNLNPDFQKAKKNLRLVENDGRGFLMLLRAIFK
jgi:tetratricopeptide (TPR) repeat protein